MDFDFEAFGYNKLYFASIEGTPYLVDFFKVIMHGEAEYKLITETILSGEKMEKIIEYRIY